VHMPCQWERGIRVSKFKPESFPNLTAFKFLEGDFLNTADPGNMRLGITFGTFVMNVIRMSPGISCRSTAVEEYLFYMTLYAQTNFLYDTIRTDKILNSTRLTRSNLYKIRPTSKDLLAPTCGTPEIWKVYVPKAEIWKVYVPKRFR
jgi:hypothetical protein